MARRRKAVDPADRPATIEMAAALAVVPYGPEIEEGAGTRQEWTARMAPRYGAVLAMVRVLQKDEQGLFELAKGAGDEAAFELHEWLHSTAKVMQAEAELMHQASARVMMGMARVAIAPPDGGA